MEKLKREIKVSAEKHYLTLQRVAPHLDSLLFSRKNGSSGHAIPFGSYINGTFTGHSDIDVYIEFNSTTNYM